MQIALIAEFVWSPRHKDLRSFFQTGIPEDNHILYAGATRFGAEHMRHRHTYTLEEVRPLHPDHHLTLKADRLDWPVKLKCL